MKPFSEAPDFGWNEKQYSYRFSWYYTCVALLAGGLFTYMFVGLAYAKNKPWDWAFAMLFFAIFLLGIQVAIVNIFGKLKLIITRDEIYIPLTWKWGSYTCIPFSEVRKIELINTKGNIFLQLMVGRKKYAITNTWFPSKGDFQEIVEIVQKRVQAPVGQVHW